MSKPDKHTSMIRDRLPAIHANALLLLIILLSGLGIGYCYFNDSPLWFIPPQTDRISYIESMQHSKLSGDRLDLLLLGSSRVAFNLSGKTLLSKLPSSYQQSAKLAFPSMRPITIYKLIQRHPVITHSKIWVFGFDDYYIWDKTTYVDYTKLSMAQQVDQYLFDSLKPIKLFKEKTETLLSCVQVFLQYEKEPYASWPLSEKMDKWIYQGLNDRIAEPHKEPRLLTSFLDAYFQNVEISNAQKDAMARLLEFAKGHHIKVVLLDIPYHPEYDRLLNERPDYFKKAQANTAYFEQLANHYNLSFISCRNEPDNCGVTQADFADPVHLNHHGSLRFSRYVAKRLQELVK
jgi:hypothetical protein